MRSTRGTHVGTVLSWRESLGTTYTRTYPCTAFGERAPARRLSQPVRNMDVYVLLYCLQREFGKLRTSATNPRLSQLPANLVAFSDTSEALDAAFLNSKSIVKTLNSCSSFFRFLYISDICLSIHPSVQPTALSCTASRAPPPASDKT